MKIKDLFEAKVKPGAKFPDQNFRVTILAAANAIARAHKALELIGQDDVLDDLESAMDKIEKMGVRF